ncbi:MAG: hypothetical protein HW421_3847 [Ignavibacteria bacterium]|nr:hypothetical protein [Ignavibacteria bacterium]
MDLATKKLSLIQWLSELNDISIINKIEKLKSEIITHQNLMPLTIDDLIDRHNQAEQDIRTNSMIDQEALASYFQNK